MVHVPIENRNALNVPPRHCRCDRNRVEETKALSAVAFGIIGTRVVARRSDERKPNSSCAEPSLCVLRCGGLDPRGECAEMSLCVVRFALRPRGEHRLNSLDHRAGCEPGGSVCLGAVVDAASAVRFEKRTIRWLIARST